MCQCKECTNKEMELLPEFEGMFGNEFESMYPEMEFEVMNETTSRSSVPYIKWVQESLNTILGLNLAVDGDKGPKTRSAIRSFQSQNGLNDDGIVGPKTEAAIIAANKAPRNRNGANYIKWLQRALGQAGSLQVAETGRMTPYTVKSIKYFQRKWGQPETGVADVQLDLKLVQKGADCCPPK
jgi:peptidoglycan hydrolase-like protein with peptidoglycan-binding domain